MRIGKLLLWTRIGYGDRLVCLIETSGDEDAQTNCKDSNHDGTTTKLRTKGSYAWRLKPVTKSNELDVLANKSKRKISVSFTLIKQALYISPLSILSFVDKKMHWRTAQ